MMDLEIPSLFSFLFTFLIISIFLLLLLKITNSHHPSKLPPGPWKLPILGNLHQLISSPLPHYTLRDLAKKHGPFLYLKLGQVPTIVVSSPDFAKEVMKTHDVTFATRPSILATEIMSYCSSNLAFAPYGDYWRQTRKIFIQELLSPSRVQSFKPVRKDELTKLVKFIASNIGSPVNISERIISMAFSIVSLAAFGKRSRDQEKFLEIQKESIKTAGGFDLVDLFPSVRILRKMSSTRTKLERLHRVSDMLLDNIIHEHKEKNAEAKFDQREEAEEDLLDVLMKFLNRSDNSFSLTTENIKALILDIFGAGSDTSSITVDWAMAEMMKNPRVMEKAQEEVREVFNRKGSVDETCLSEMTYLKCVIKEILRLHPPVPLLLPRECRENCEINGYEVPAKTKVIVNAWAIGRDPKYWTEPESFIPERFLSSSIDFKGTNFEYIPFGAGRRMCPGIWFGMINVELPLALLLYHFDWKLPKGMKPEDVDMTESFGATVRREVDLLLVPIAYYPSPCENKHNGM